jgi:uncharacterized protein YciI
MVRFAGPLAAGLLMAVSLGAAPITAAPRAESSTEARAPVAKGRLYAVVLGPGQAWKKGQPFKGPGLDQHRAYWKGLLGEGRIAAAGPLGDGSGLALIRAKNQKEADALLAADPAVKARILRAVARPYAADLMSVAVLVGR